MLLSRILLIVFLLLHYFLSRSIVVSKSIISSHWWCSMAQPTHYANDVSPRSSISAQNSIRHTILWHNNNTKITKHMLDIDTLIKYTLPVSRRSSCLLLVDKQNATTHIYTYLCKKCRWRARPFRRSSLLYRVAFSCTPMRAYMWPRRAIIAWHHASICTASNVCRHWARLCHTQRVLRRQCIDIFLQLSAVNIAHTLVAYCNISIYIVGSKTICYRNAAAQSERIFFLLEQRCLFILHILEFAPNMHYRSKVVYDACSGTPHIYNLFAWRTWKKASYKDI